MNSIFCVADTTFCVADSTFCVADTTFCVADSTFCVAETTFCVADSTFCVADTTFCHKVCLLPTVAMLESQSDELCGLRQTAVSCAIFDVVIAARYF